MASTLGEGPDLAQGPCQPRPGNDPLGCAEHVRLPGHSLYVPPQQLGGPAEATHGRVGQPQTQGGIHLQGTIAERGRECKGLLARDNGAVKVSRCPACLGHLGEHPSQPGSVVKRPRQGLGLAQ